MPRDPLEAPTPRNATPGAGTAVRHGASLAPGHAPTLPALLLAAAARFRDRAALGTATSAARLTFGEAEATVARLAALLAAHGVGAGDRVAILSENRPEWWLVDHAVLSIGAVTVPIYPSLPAAQAAEILADSGARLAFASTAAQAAKLHAAGGATRELVIVTFERAAAGTGAIALDDALAAAAPTSGASLEAWRARARAVAPDDLATLIYTSGTTGTPKGVMLTHANLAAMIAATRQHGSLDVRPGEVALSILPLAHVFERAASHYFLSEGVTVVVGESMQTVARDIAAVRPHHLVAVPRLFEKVHDAVVGAPGIRGRIARAAAATARAWTDAVTHGRRPSALLRARHALADRLVYRVLRARMGGRMRTFICGGAPLDPRVGALFHAAGLPVYEGYGLTETSPVISANRPGAVRLGSAGVPYPGVSVRLGEAGEIQVRGPGVTRGYWGRPDATAEAFTADGWLRTGDVGAFDGDFLLVVDRLKDLVVTAGGKNVAPQPLEGRVTASPLVAQAVLLGDRRPYLVMLVVPEEGAAADGDDALAARIAAEVAERLREAASVERPKRIAVVRAAFTVENELMTPTLKIRRRRVETAYAALLDDLYAGRAGTAVPWEP